MKLAKSHLATSHLACVQALHICILFWHGDMDWERSDLNTSYAHHWNSHVYTETFSGTDIQYKVSVSFIQQLLNECLCDQTRVNSFYLQLLTWGVAWPLPGGSLPVSRTESFGPIATPRFYQPELNWVFTLTTRTRERADFVPRKEVLCS